MSTTHYVQLAQVHGDGTVTMLTWAITEELWHDVHRKFNGAAPPHRESVISAEAVNAFTDLGDHFDTVTVERE